MPLFDTSLFRFRLSSLHLSSRTLGVYFAGVMFASAVWVFVDTALYSAFNYGSTLHITFIDWIPFLCSVLGMIIVNSIDKSRLSGDSFAYTDESLARKARFILFIGFALLAGGLGGSFTVFILKYVVPGYSLTMGIANVICNVLFMISATTLWITGNMNDDYHYNLQL
ncbi:vacuolar sorting protein Vps68 [Schizosaccharomyces cryophilus OY26]|uniref:Vacuolar sorting protein Vps68 n=1 Tax=Schizosaccharomyces cryophilus (strain OY26 / ATCC MYA-4695 / CBS 11777 / NBRC 106824 / NRRL Y48691) TaxID=653667 RepID=S9WX14_SCHCR|nr:vacuolar sorting protein Vps68 [Schizosaccharomyces cryophilus OY26]EPY49277.1 vacuolar sorting protein Vps68 [Schizosaccharomyces cryophilus OY26]